MIPPEQRKTLIIGSALSLLIAFSVWQSSHSQLRAQGSTINLRPSAYTGSTLTNPGNAYDWIGTTPNVSSSAYTYLTRNCSSHCTNVTTAGATWLGVDNGYHGIRIEVRWMVTGTVTVFTPDTARLEALLEYSLDGGGSWSNTWDGENTAYSWTATTPGCSNHGITCGDHVSTATLPNFIHTGDIQVRATATAQMTNCQSCSSSFSGLSEQFIYLTFVLSPTIALSRSQSQQHL